MSFTCDYKCPLSELDIPEACVQVETIIYQPGRPVQVVYLVYASEQAKLDKKGYIFREVLNIPAPFDGWDADMSAVMVRAEDAIKSKINPPIEEEQDV